MENVGCNGAIDLIAWLTRPATAAATAAAAVTETETMRKKYKRRRSGVFP